MTEERFISSISLPGEKWRDVVGYEGLYIVSSFGRLAYLKRAKWPTRLMKPFRSKKHRKQSYLHVKLTKNGESRHYTIHRLVASAFIPNPSNYPCVDHIDGNGENNHVNNLRWCTRSMNNMNPISRKRQSESHLGKIQSKNVRKAIVQLKNNTVIKIFDSMTEAENSGFQHSCISLTCRGKAAHHKGFQWMFLSDYETLVDMSKNSTDNGDV